MLYIITTTIQMEDHMGVKERAEKRGTERMSDGTFRGMAWLMNVIDFFYPYIKKRVEKFGIREGMTVVDYGCGPGRYTVKFASLVGGSGKIYAVDIHELAMEYVRRKMGKYKISNIEPVLAKGYNSTLPEGVADVVCAIDMFFSIKKPSEFLAELKRITKYNGTLVIDDGHQPRQETKDKIIASGCWDIVEETKDHLKCKPKYS
jgi:ubiquinone/menaquinone biosynthesis C-methylase UbiE